MYILYPEIMGKIDKLTEKKYGIKSIVLMENAGLSVSNHIIEHFKPARILVMCGPGNNGGDAFVAARHLYNKHYNVHIALFAQHKKFTGNALINMEIARKLKIPIFSAFNKHKFSQAVNNSDLIIDGVFGTGFKGKLKSSYIQPFKTINKSKKDIVSIDIPSGIDGLTGIPAEYALKAVNTVTFAAAKTGLLWNRALMHTGDLFVADISIPDEAILCQKHFYMLNRDTVHMLYNNFIAQQKPFVHKMEKGRLLVIGGDKGMQGAPQMSAISGLKSGAGVSYVYLIEQASKKFYAETVFTEDYNTLLDKQVPVIIGPGMGTGIEAQSILKHVLEKSQNALIDADGINILSMLPKKTMHSLIRGRIITPHPEEFRRLSGCSFSNIDEKIKCAEQFALKHNTLLVLKSPPTIITDGKTTFIFPFMSEKLATAGSGDVLAGIIGGLIAAGMGIFYAALTGVYLHFVSGINARGKSITADDIIKNINKETEGLVI